MAINNTVQIGPQQNLLAQSAKQFANTPAQSALNSKIASPTALVGMLAPKPFASTGSLSAPGVSGGYDAAPTQAPTQTKGLVSPAPVANVSTAGSLPLVNPNASYQDVKGGVAGTPVQPGLVQSPTTFSGAVSGLAGFNPLSNPAVSGAYQKAQDINNQIEQSKRNEANAEAENRLNPIPIGDQTGREAIIRNQYLAQQSALSGQLQGQSTLYQAGLTSTGQQLSGLNSAAGLSAPQQVSYNNQYLNPQTGQPINPGASGDLNSAVQLQVQKIQNGTTDPQSAAAALSAYGQAGTNALQQALGPNFNLNIASGIANAQGAVAGQQSQQVQQYQSALQQGKNLQSQLSDLIGTFGLNPSDINAANAGLQAIARNTSSSQYKILQNYVNDIANTYAQVLTPTGGSQTDTTRSIATSMLDATASGQSIQAVMQSLDQAAQAKIAGVSTLSGSTNNQSNGNIFSW